MENWFALLLTALLLIIAFVIGLLIGWLAKRMFAPAAPSDETSQVATTSASTVSTSPSAAAAASPATASAEPEAKAEQAKPASAAKKSAPKKPAEPKSAPSKSAAKPKAAKKTKAKSAGAAKSGPEKLSAPRGGKADDLKQISGVGPKLEEKLNGLGIFHFDQIAAWKKADIDWVDDELSFKGRITRDKWVAQAKKLAK